MNKGMSALCKSVIYAAIVAGQLQAAEPEYLEDEASYTQQNEEMAKGWGWKSVTENGIQAMIQCTTFGSDCSTDPCIEFDMAVAKPQLETKLTSGFGNKLSGSVVYVGGTRYSFSKSSLTPIYQDLSGGECPNGTKLVGYKTQFSVIGDTGQQLIFDMSGQSDRSVSLSASCGSFSGSDSGTKYIIGREMSTGGSCRSMNLDFRFNWRLPPSSINLNLSILEKF